MSHFAALMRWMRSSRRRGQEVTWPPPYTELCRLSPVTCRLKKLLFFPPHIVWPVFSRTPPSGAQHGHRPCQGKKESGRRVSWDRDRDLSGGYVTEGPLCCMKRPTLSTNEALPQKRLNDSPAKHGGDCLTPHCLMSVYIQINNSNDRC